MSKHYKEQSESLEQCAVGEALLKTYVKYTINQLFQKWHKSTDNLNLCTIESYSNYNKQQTPKQTHNHWVWLQGYISDISNDGDILQISDNPSASFISRGASSVLVINCKRTPGEIDSSAKDKYFQGNSNSIKLIKPEGHSIRNYHF